MAFWLHERRFSVYGSCIAGQAMRMRLNAPLGPAEGSSHGNGILGKEGANPFLGITTVDRSSWQASASNAARIKGRSRPQATGCRRRLLTRHGRYFGYSSVGVVAACQAVFRVARMNCEAPTRKARRKM